MPGRGQEAGPGTGAPADVEVNWEALRALIDSARPLTAAGRAAAVRALRILEDLLGHGWVRRTRRETGWLPGELTYAGFHRVALPQLLATATRLDRFRSTPGFDRVVRELRRNPSPDRWRHMLLQLEIARAAVVFGGRCEFEPRVEGSTRFADVFVHADGGSFIVETTTVFRDDLSRRTQEYEDQRADYLRRIEVHYGVSTRTQLDSHLSDSDTRAWLARVETAARHVRDHDNAIKVASSAGVVVVSRQPLSIGTTTFSGVALTRDGLRRFVRTLLAKTRHSAGPQPAWLRVDVADGLWQFTDWAHASLATKRGSLVPMTSLLTIGTGRSDAGTSKPGGGCGGCDGCHARPRR